MDDFAGVAVPSCPAKQKQGHESLPLWNFQKRLKKDMVSEKFLYWIGLPNKKVLTRNGQWAGAKPIPRNNGGGMELDFRKKPENVGQPQDLLQPIYGQDLIDFMQGLQESSKLVDRKISFFMSFEMNTQNRT